MIEFIRQIADLLSSVLGFIITGIYMLIEVLSLCIKAMGFLVAAVASLPAFVSVFVILSISIAVILFLLDRG